MVGNMAERKTLAEFILDEMRRLDMSARQFADLIGVSNTTINRALSSDPPTPSLEFLDKLARATGQDLPTVVLMAMPGADEPDAGARVIANYIYSLPLADQREAETFVLGLLTRAGRKKRMKENKALGKGESGKEKGE